MVGAALRETPEGLSLPWQRVINAQGTVSHRSGLGVEEGYQRHLLEEEGVQFNAHGRVDLERYRWDPDEELPGRRPARPRRRRGAPHHPGPPLPEGEEGD